jgi:peroxiredoxin
LKKILLIIGIFLFTTPAFAGIKVNEAAPAFTLRDMQGKEFNLADFVGTTKKEPGRGVVLSFFASWCVSCRNELPLINSLTDELYRKGIKVVIIDVKDNEKTINDLLVELKVTRPLVLSDRSGKVSSKYGVLFLPVTYFVGSDGKVKSVIFGEIENEKKLEDSASKIAQ